jgi:hypothetical protein
VGRHSTKKKSPRFANKTRGNVETAFADARELSFVTPLPYRFGAFSTSGIDERVTADFPLPPEQASRKRRMVYRLLTQLCETHEDIGSLSGGRHLSTNIYEGGIHGNEHCRLALRLYSRSGRDVCAYRGGCRRSDRMP